MPKGQKKNYNNAPRRKALPHDTNAEKAVLGAMFTNEELAVEALTRLSGDDFYCGDNNNHKIIFLAMKRVYDNHTPIDFQTVCDELINANELDIVGGTEYLFNIANNFVGYENAKHCITMVYDQSILRHYLEGIHDIEERYYTTQIDNISEFISESEKSLNDIAKERTVEDWKSSKEVTDSLQYRMEKMKKADQEGNIGVTTGYPSLNELIHGFQPGQFVILAARPAVGKTAFGLNLCYNAAQKQYPVAYFSLEMSAESLMTRIISSESRVSQDAINLGTATREEKLAIKQACDTVGKFPLYIDDTAGIKVSELMAKTRKLKNEVPNLGLVVVDYIGLVRVSDKQSAAESRQLIIQETSQELKRLALELDIAILCVAQLNRGVEQRESGVPMLSDLRESGSLEQDADVVMLMHAEGIDSKKMKKFGREEDGKMSEDSRVSALQTKLSELGKNTQLININIAKNRSGKTGNVILMFKKDVGRFDEPDQKFLKQYRDIKAGVVTSKEE